MTFSPIIYEHAARLLGKSPWQVSRDSDLLFQAHAAAFRLYRHSPVVAGIDLYNVEAEAYGAVVDAATDNRVPAITQYVCRNSAEIIGLASFDPARSGRIPMIIDAGKRLGKELPEAEVKIPVSGPFSLASILLGFETLLLETLDAPERLGAALQFLAVGQITLCEEIARHGLDAIIFESSASPPLLSPPMFVNLELPALRSLQSAATAIFGHPLPCIIGGNTALIVDEIMQTGTDYVICPAETDQMAFMTKMERYPEVMVRVNMNPGVFTAGSWQKVIAETNRVLTLAHMRDAACVGTGVLPYDTDPQSIIALQNYLQTKETHVNVS